MIEKRYN